jgi:hypothetical protein
LRALTAKWQWDIFATKPKQSKLGTAGKRPTMLDWRIVIGGAVILVYVIVIFLDWCGRKNL